MQLIEHFKWEKSANMNCWRRLWEDPSAYGGTSARGPKRNVPAPPVLAGLTDSIIVRDAQNKQGTDFR